MLLSSLCFHVVFLLFSELKKINSCFGVSRSSFCSLFSLFFFCTPACASLPHRATILAVFCFFFFVHPVGSAWHRAAFSFLYPGVFSLPGPHAAEGRVRSIQFGKVQVSRVARWTQWVQKENIKKKKKRLLGRKTVVCRQRKAAMWVFVVVFLSRGNRQSVAWSSTSSCGSRSFFFFFLSPLTVFSWMPASLFLSFFFCFGLPFLRLACFSSREKKKKKLQHTLFFFFPFFFFVF